MVIVMRVGREDVELVLVGGKETDAELVVLMSSAWVARM